MSLADGLAWEAASDWPYYYQVRERWKAMRDEMKTCDSAPVYPFKAGDRVRHKDGSAGMVVGIDAGDAWVRLETGGHRTTVLRNLTPAPKPRQGTLATFEMRTGCFLWDFPGVTAVELTPEVRERIKDLL